MQLGDPEYIDAFFSAASVNNTVMPLEPGVSEVSYVHISPWQEKSACS